MTSGSSAMSATGSVGTGLPNSMHHFDGNGTSPSGPSHGNVGVIGKYGVPSSRASGLKLPSIGYVSSAPTMDTGVIGTRVCSAADTNPPRPKRGSLYRSRQSLPIASNPSWNP